MQQAIDAVGADQIATNQIELSPFLQNEKWWRSHGSMALPSPLI